MSDRVNFKVERLKRGLSQDNMAKLMGVSADVVRTLENGGIPQHANRLKVAKFYGCEILDIWPLDVLERAA